MFEIVNVITKQGNHINEDILHSYYCNGDILIKTEEDRWYITVKGTRPPIEWEEITDLKKLLAYAETMEDVIDYWYMDDISERVEINNAIEVWYKE